LGKPSPTGLESSPTSLSCWRSTRNPNPARPEKCSGLSPCARPSLCARVELKVSTRKGKEGRSGRREIRHHGQKRGRQRRPTEAWPSVHLLEHIGEEEGPRVAVVDDAGLPRSLPSASPRRARGGRRRHG
jgi:hypothetical protein